MSHEERVRRTLNRMKEIMLEKEIDPELVRVEIRADGLTDKGKDMLTEAMRNAISKHGVKAVFPRYLDHV